MFESAELGHRIDKDVYERELPALRKALLDAQYENLRAARFPVVLVIGGVDGAGKGETVNALLEWMDPRHIAAHAFGPPTDEESARAPMWRFWRALPPRGRIGILFGSWYTAPIVERVFKRISGDELDRRLGEIERFERMLADEGALIIKLWFHLGKKQQKRRLEELASSPRTSWRVTQDDWDKFAHYDRFARVSERALRQTSLAHAPWIVIEGGDARYRSLTAGRALLGAMRQRLDAAPNAGSRAPTGPAPAPLPAAPVDGVRLVDRIDLTQKLDKDSYEDQREKLERKLNLLLRRKRFLSRHSVVAVFEGADAAGKGGSIRRITHALDARQYRVIPVAAPTEEERAQPYLWRFWRHMPAYGSVTLFDRSWYGRVLVERVEGLIPAADWQRAYAEINDFESDLAGHGVVVVKFWLQISPEEQLRRFQEREQIGFKNFKITPDDWRNRDKWDAYRVAMSDMVERTSTELAPWTLVSAEDKRFARITVLRTLCDRIEAEL